MQRPIILTLIALLALLSPSAFAQDDEVTDTVAEPTRVPGVLLLRASELEALGDTLERSIFRAYASQLPPRFYRQQRMVYDGAVIAITHPVTREIAFLTTATWLTGAESVALSADSHDTHVLLRVDAFDARLDLALLTLEDPEDAAKFVPVEIAPAIPMNAYTLLSPHTRLEQVAAVAVLERVGVEDDPERRVGVHDPSVKTKSFFWLTSLAAANGYPIVDGEGRLVALQTRRDPTQPATRGHAVGVEHVQAFLGSIETLQAKERGEEDDASVTIESVPGLPKAEIPSASDIIPHRGMKSRRP